MISRILVVFLCGGALALACGPRAHSTAQPAADTATMDAIAEEGKPLATSLNVSVRDEVIFTFHVTNVTGKQLEITFPSGQTHDFAVLDTAGREVWRWSAGRMFTQALQTRQLDPRETASYEQRWSPGGRIGTFTAVAVLTSSTHPLEERVTFVLP